MRERDARNRSGLFVAEGGRFLLSALQNHCAVRAVFYSPALLNSSAIRHAINHLVRAGAPCLRVSADAYSAFSLSSEPSGVALVAEQRWDRLIDQPCGKGDLWVALDQVRTPGNLGTILRTCEAVGASGVMLIGGMADPYDPGCVRASMGAIFSQRLVRTSARALEGWKRRRNCLVVGAAPDGARDYRGVDMSGPTILMMGSERTGLRPKQANLCDRMVKIPMAGPTDSLNLAIATGVLLYEAYGQRHPVPGRPVDRNLAPAMEVETTQIQSD